MAKAKESAQGCEGAMAELCEAFHEMLLEAHIPFPD